MKPLALGIALLCASAAALAQPAAGPAQPAAGPAQPAAGPARPDPRDAAAPVPPVAYRSPFAQYRPYSAHAPGPWRDMNDLVGRIGGWKVYARESLEAPAAAEVAQKPGATPPDSGKPAPR